MTLPRQPSSHRTKIRRLDDSAECSIDEGVTETHSSDDEGQLSEEDESTCEDDSVAECEEEAEELESPASSAAEMLAEVRALLEGTVAETAFAEMLVTKQQQEEQQPQQEQPGRPSPKPERCLRGLVCNNQKCKHHNQSPVLHPKRDTGTPGQEALALCCACNKRYFRLEVGTSCIEYEGDKLGLLVGLRKGREYQLHVQRLRRDIQVNGDCLVNLISTDGPPVLRLQDLHETLPASAFAAWCAAGAARVLEEPPVLFFYSTWPETRPGPRDFFALPRGGVGVARSDCGCGCWKPWGQHLREGDVTAVSSCSSEAGSPPTPQGIQPGDLVWLKPEGSEVDTCLELVRVCEVPKEQGEGKARRFRVHKFTRHDSVEGHRFQPTPAVISVPKARLCSEPDPLTLPGVQVVREDGLEERAPPTSDLPPPRVEIYDLFSGFGGLSRGFEQAGVGEPVLAVDLFPAALETFRRCHPSARIFSAGVSSFLRGVREGKEGHPTPEPRPGTLRLMVAGPPCQGFSGANKGDKEAKLAKNVLMLLHLAVVEALRPELLVIENVVGMLRTDMMMERILQVLVSLGYQVRWRVVTVGCYGLATHRRRVIITAAQAGQPLPAFPLPSHVFNAGGYNAAAPTEPCSLAAREEVAWRGVPTQWRSQVLIPTNAPLPRLSVRDVIGDLPEEEAEGPVAYSRGPRSFFARCVRGKLQQVSGHQSWSLGEKSSRRGEKTRRRIALIPKEGQPPPAGRECWEGAATIVENAHHPPRSGDWRSLPENEQPRWLRDRRDNGNLSEGVLGRLVWGGQFGTLLTRNTLYRDTANCLIHPTADRPLTAREAARVQGIPDSVEFAGTPAEVYRQIGNCVPVPLGAALGRELKRVLAAAAAAGARSQAGGS